MAGLAPVPAERNRAPGKRVMDGAGLLARSDFQSLIDALAADGYRVIGPTLDAEAGDDEPGNAEAGAIVLDDVSRAEDLPAGWVEDQAPGRYRLARHDTAALFAHTHGPHSWKKVLHPARLRLWRAERRGDDFEVSGVAAETRTEKTAFLGVRGCDLAAIGAQDRVFDNGAYRDEIYWRRRESVFLVAVNCTRAGGTCFCASMGTGPRAGAGHDVVMTELVDDGRHVFLMEAGSAAGARIMAGLPLAPATPADRDRADELLAATAAHMGREMAADAAGILRRNPLHARWADVAARCLSCGNCTMVCPTCFCTTTEDTQSLTGAVAERWRFWDSCFNLGFSLVHGAAVRQEGWTRYRHWITHKLSTWHDQFGQSGCVGCGRCITWCPTGIDITEEVDAIAASEREG